MAKGLKGGLNSRDAIYLSIVDTDDNEHTLVASPNGLYFDTTIDGTWSRHWQAASKSDLIKHSRISFDWTPPGENSSIDCTVVLPVDYSKIVCISVNTNTTNAYAAVRAATGLLCYIKVIQIAGISVTSVTGYVDVLYTE